MGNSRAAVVRFLLSALAAESARVPCEAAPDEVHEAHMKSISDGASWIAAVGNAATLPAFLRCVAWIVVGLRSDRVCRHAGRSGDRARASAVSYAVLSGEQHERALSPPAAWGQYARPGPVHP